LRKFITIICCAGMAAGFLPLEAQRKRLGSEKTAPAEAEYFFTEGQKYFVLEDYAKALLYFQQAADRAPHVAAIRYKMSEVYAKKQQGDDLRRAAAEIELALQLEKKNKFYYAHAADVYGSLLEFKKAQQVLETMQKEAPGSEEYLYNLAAFYLYDNQPQEALRVYNQIEGLTGVDEVTARQKQKIFIEQGRLREAFAESEKLVDAFPEEEQYVIDHAQLLAQHKKITEAVALLEKWLGHNPGASRARFLLAGYLRDAGQAARSQQLLWENFNDPAADLSSKILVMGTYNAWLGGAPQAVRADESTAAFAQKLCTRLRELHADEPAVYVVCADMALVLGDPKEAFALYYQATRHGETRFEVWQNLLVLASQLHRTDSLVRYAEQALELFPNQPEVYYFLGYGQFVQQQYRAAVQALEQAGRLAMGNTALQNEINTLLGDGYNALKDYAKSDRAYLAVLQTDPANAIVLNNYSYYLALRKENLEKAEKMSAQLVKDYPTNAAFLDTHAWVLFMRGKYREARKWMEKAIELDDTRAIYFEHLGDILFRLGETQEAVAQWERARAIDPANEALKKKLLEKTLY
jgi:tetratricopeptide (TPR) repeat protein